MRKGIVASACLLILMLSSNGYSQFDYPAAIQAKFDSFQYVPVSVGELGHDVPGFSDSIGTYVVVLDLDAVPIDDEILIIRYPVSAGSQQIASNAPSGNYPFTGYAFLEGRTNFDLDVQNVVFNLYLEQILPSVVFGFDFEYETIDLMFETDAAALAGYGSYCFDDKLVSIESCGPICDSSLQDLSSNRTPIVCLSGYCCASAEFGLPGFQYVSTGAGNSEVQFEPVTEFDFSQPNFNLLYRQISVSETPGGEFFRSQSFEIPLFQLGDTNMDGEVDLLDVSGFVDCLASGLYVFQCDIDSNLEVNLLDVAGFVDLVVGN